MKAKETDSFFKKNVWENNFTLLIIAVVLGGVSVVAIPLAFVLIYVVYQLIKHGNVKQHRFVKPGNTMLKILILMLFISLLGRLGV